MKEYTFEIDYMTIHNSRVVTNLKTMTIKAESQEEAELKIQDYLSENPDTDHWLEILDVRLEG